MLCGRKNGEFSSRAGTFSPGFLQSAGCLTKKSRPSLLVVLCKLGSTRTFLCEGVVKLDCGSLKIGKMLSAIKRFSSLE